MKQYFVLLVGLFIIQISSISAQENFTKTGKSIYFIDSPEGISLIAKVDQELDLVIDRLLTIRTLYLTQMRLSMQESEHNQIVMLELIEKCQQLIDGIKTATYGKIVLFDDTNLDWVDFVEIESEPYSIYIILPHLLSFIEELFAVDRDGNLWASLDIEKIDIGIAHLLELRVLAEYWNQRVGA